MFRRRREPTRLTLFFATDIHGSDACFRKFVAAKKAYGADRLILGGDLTGKMIIPFVYNGTHYDVDFAGQRVTATEETVKELESTVSNAGYYPLIIRGAESVPSDRVEQLFVEKIIERLLSWNEFAVSRGLQDDASIIVAPGNDDPFEIDAVLDKLPGFTLAESKVMSLAAGTTEFRLASSGWSNPTPWNTHRERSEDELRESLFKLVEGEDPDRTILNVHVPPYNSTLDEGPEIDEAKTRDSIVVQRTSLGNPLTAPVGSTGVRQLIEEFQPILSLHGHIHESRRAVTIGRTLCINPGSDYSEQVLRGVIVRLGDEGAISHQLTSG
jgi:Icc-related predicted phosphoesterase